MNVLRNLSIAALFTGLGLLVALVCLVGVHKPPVHVAAGWVIASGWIMAAGMWGLVIVANRQSRMCIHSRRQT